MTAPRQLDLLFDAYRVDERVSSRARCIRIEVRSPSEVRLTIPRSVAKSEAREFLLSREGWIREKVLELKQKLAKQPERPPAQLKWDGTDLLPFRGVELPLRLFVTRARKPSVRMSERAIEVLAPTALLGQITRLEKGLRDALKREALLHSQRVLEHEAERLGVRFSGPRIADQKTLWGSCTAQGLISLSWRLVMAPPAVLRYVVVHELCHVRHHDHGQRFWKLVARQMPDFETHRRWLREHGPALHWWLAG